MRAGVALASRTSVRQVEESHLHYRRLSAKDLQWIGRGRYEETQRAGNARVVPARTSDRPGTCNRGVDYGLAEP